MTNPNLIMKRFIKYSLILIGLGLSTQAFSQWQYNGNKIYYNDGRVGIGTSNPTKKFEVAGDILVGSNNMGYQLKSNSGISRYGLKYGNAGTIGGSNHLALTNRENNGDLRFQTSPGGGGTNEVTRMTIDGITGKVGIGTTSPDEKLTIDGGNLLIKHSSQAPTLIFHDNDDNDEFSWAFSRSNDRLDLEINGTDTHSFLKNGAVGIGTSTVPSGYKLAIKGKAIVEEIKVELNTNWPDYVFSDDYRLRSLTQLEAYVKQNKHLPGIPSQKEVEEEGILLGEMQGKLLEKIEELTLYLIKQNQRIQQLESQVKVLQKP